MHMPVTYEIEDGVALLTMDDGKVNALSIEMFAALNEALSKAEDDKAIPIITGRDGIFSAGFDMKQMARTAEKLHGVLTAGAETCVRLLQYPMPTIVACSGHAFPAGTFIMMSSDYRIGADGDYRIGLNEVLINMTIPHFAIELARSRLSANYLNRTTLTGEMFAPREAIAAGFLDEVVLGENLIDAAKSKAESLKAVIPPHHHATKLRLRAPVIQALRTAIDRELTVEKAQNAFV